MFSLCIFVSGEHVNQVLALLAAGGHPATAASPSTDAGRFRVRCCTTERCGSELLSVLVGFLSNVAQRLNEQTQNARDV
jgi:hypothetical protein